LAVYRHASVRMIVHLYTALVARIVYDVGMIR
jgi:hypothetical protein